MTITLKLLHETSSKLYFELTITVVYAGKTVGEFSMSSPSGLIRALNMNGQKLHELFQGKESFKAYWESAHISRKKIVVKRYETQAQFVAVMSVSADIKISECSKRNCAICGIECKKSKKMIGCCSDACYRCKLAQRNESVKKSHWCKSSAKTEITQRRIETRKKNDESQDRTYVPWNKDKTGVYSPNTIEKIRAATRLQFHREIFKKTAIERKVDDFLKEMNVNYKYSFILNGRQYDFLLKDCNAVVEVHGDFWHGNPEFWGEGKRQLRDHQIMKRLDDSIKKRIAKENGYEYFEFWEYDIHNNWAVCSARIKEMINGSH